MEQLDKNGLTEEEYIEKYKSKNYPKPALTADIVLFGDERTKLLLIRRGGHPYIGQWAFPGGFAESTETIENTAARELEEETGLFGIYMDPVGLFTKPGRDPRGWTVSMAFAADVVSADCNAAAGDDAAAAQWFDLVKNENRITLTGSDSEIIFDYEFTETGVNVKFVTSDILAFDHAEILVRALIM